MKTIKPSIKEVIKEVYEKIDAFIIVDVEDRIND